MCKGKISKIIVGILLVALIVSNLIVPIQSVLAVDEDGAQVVTRGGYYDLPQTVENYATSGKTLEFDLNILIASTDVCKLGLYDGSTFVSSEFTLRDGEQGLKMTVEPIEDGWYHYTISLASVPHSDAQNESKFTRIRARSTFPTGTKINNISIGIDIQSLPEAFTDDYDTVTLADLKIAGTDYKTPVSSGTYEYDGKSATKSVIVKFGWEPNFNDTNEWKIALDTYWNSNCMVWFQPGKIYFCPGEGSFTELRVELDPITSGRHDVEFGRLRVTAGPNHGKDYVFLKVDGEVIAAKYTDHYQTPGGYIAYNDTKTNPSYTVCFVTDGVSKQGFSGFAKPDEYVSDVDYVNIGDIVPEGVVKDSVHDGFLGYRYPFKSLSKTNSTVVNFVIKTGDLEDGALDGSVMVVDIGGNCGFCRSYIPSGEKNQIMFGWEIEGCTSGTKKYTFESNSWYAVEQGRIRIASGINKGKDYVYLKINGELVSYFYGNPESRPLLGDEIYIEATHNIQIVGYDELRAKYYVDDGLYLDQLAQKGFNLKQPADPVSDGQYFVGWYTAKTGGKLFDFKNTKLTDNINLYARFTNQTVKATFNPVNGGESSTVTVGKNCLVTEPEAPSSYTSGGYEYIFVGWRNETTGKIFNFETDRISANTTFTAQYKEKEYFVSFYANGKLVKKVSFVLSNPTIKGKEPSVPKIANTTGVWETHSVNGLTKNMTVNAVYTVKVPSSSTAVKLNKYSGGKIYLNTDLIHDYLSTDTSKQTAFVSEFYSTQRTNYQDYQNTSFKWTDSGKNSKYTVYFADNKNFKNPYIVTTNKKSLTNEVGIFVPGKTYYWFVCGNNTGKCSAVDSFTIVNTPIRYINAGNVINMRDLGGQVNKDGDRVKYELIYRGAALDEYTSHLDDDARYVFDYLGMKSEIELRGGMQHDYSGWDENNSNVYYARGAAYQEIFSMGEDQKTQYKAMFEALADENNYPFYFHCSAGADRTGTLAYLLYALLGVSYDDIRPEYELTSFSAIGLRAADNYSNGLSLDETKRTMLEEYGNGSENLQSAVQNYLINYVGISKATLDSIKNILLDKNSGSNEKPNTITVDVLGKKYTYQAFSGIYFMPEEPKAMGKIFKGFYNGNTKYNGYTNKDIKLTAKFEDIEYETYDTITLKDLGINKNKILNQTNTVYTYKKLAKSGGRLLQFVLEPVGSMNNGDGPQIALTNDWSKNSFARVWFQTNTMSHVYYNGAVDSGPDISKMISLDAGKQYNIKFAVRVMKNKGYEGKKILEVTVNGELLVQYIGCKADLSENKIFFHGGTGSAYLINKPVYKTVKLYNGNTLMGSYKVERSGLLPKVEEPAPKNGLPFAGWRTEKSGGEVWDENADRVYKNMSLYAYFANIKVITANVNGKKLTYRVEVGKTLDELPKPKKSGHVFIGWTVNGKIFTGKVTKNMTVNAKFEEYKYQPYDTITLKDLGINKNKILNQTNTVYTYKKTAESGGRLLQFVLEPIGNMKNGDGPQIALTNDWSKNSYARVWLQSNSMSHIYYKGVLDSGPDISKEISLEAGKRYNIEYAVRVLANKGYEGIKVLEVRVNGELLLQYAGCKADLSENKIFFHGSTGAAYLINKPVYKTVKFYNGNTLMGTYKVERSGLLPKVEEPAPKNGLPFAGWRTEKSGGTVWDENADLVYNNISLYAYFANIKVITAKVGSKKLTYRVEVGKTLDGLPKPKKAGYVFMGWTVNGKMFTGKVTKNMTVTAKFEEYKYQPYDTISLKDLGIEDNKILNQTNMVYTYEKTAESGGRLLQFVLEPIGNMKNGDGPQVAITNDWSKNSYARVWFQNNTSTHIYYKGILDSGPDISKELSLEAGKKYNIEYSVRVLANKGYEGIKVFEVKVDGKLLIQYMGCKADLSENTIYFHGGTGSAYLINKPVYKTVKFYNGNTLIDTRKVERCGLIPDIKEPSPQNGLPFAGWYTAKSGGELWDENADLVYGDMNLYAHFADVKVITANVDGKKLIYRVEVGKTLEELPKPQKSGHVFMGWLSNGELFTGKVTQPMNITASFEAYSFDDYDEISLRDLGIYNDLNVGKLGPNNTANYTYHKSAETGGRVFKAIYIPTENMSNGPQVSFSPKWDENYFAKLYFTKADKLYVYSSGIDGGLPTLTMDAEFIGGKQYPFEIGVRVLNNKGYKGVKVLTVYLNGKLIFEEFDNKANIEGADVFFQGMPNTGIFRNVDIYKTVSFYDGDELLSSVKVLRGERVKSYGSLADKGDRLFKGWFTEFGQEWNFDTDSIYLDTVFKAKFQKRTYPVLLMVDGILYKRLNIFAGEIAQIYDIPTKEGYEFDKWLTEDGSDYDMKTPVNAPITLVASFKEAPIVETIPQNESAKPIQNKDSESVDTKFILFGIIGLVVIVTELGIIGIIIYKKRAKK